MSVLIETSLGVFVVDVYVKERPRCALNFLKLCQLKYYNFCLFHSVQKNLVAQTGDPTGSGRGGASVFREIYGDQARYFEGEKKPKIPHSRRGLVSMVENGAGQHGSQFFITLADDLDYLNGKHTVFGYLAEGTDFIDKINDVYCDKNNRPYRNVRIHHTIVLDDPFETPKGLRTPSSPLRIPIVIQGDVGPPRIEEDEELQDEVGLDPSQLGELKAEQEAKTHAQLLTLIGDLPDPNVKPPDNVLFVCRLNPVTRSEDLEIIFSRFGEIKSCEVIRDRHTGASLQYAFIEFENESDCENAFFKMDKVVIDDRRIHVDFSQSVAREWQRHRQAQEQRKLSSCTAAPKTQSIRHERSRSHSHGRRRRVFRDGRRPPTPVRRYERGQGTPCSSVERREPEVTHRRSSSRDHEDDRYCRSKRTRQSSVERSRKSSSPRRRTALPPEQEKHQPLPGTDLDLVISESDIDSSSDSSEVSSLHHVKIKHRRHGHQRDSHGVRKHGHHKKSKKSRKHGHKHHSRNRYDTDLRDAER